jgi:hypothetical protein
MLPSFTTMMPHFQNAASRKRALAMSQGSYSTESLPGARSAESLPGTLSTDSLPGAYTTSGESVHEKLAEATAVRASKMARR